MIQVQPVGINTLTMSQDEQLTKLTKDLRVVKTWWPIATAATVVIMFFMGLQSLYDNKIAKKEDVEKISNQNIEISRQLTDLKLSFNQFKQDVNTTTSHLRDSVKIALLVRKSHPIRGNQLVVERYVNGKLVFVPVK